MTNKDIHSLPVLTDDNKRAYLHEVGKKPMDAEILLLCEDPLLYRMLLFKVAWIAQENYGLLDLHNIRTGAMLSYGALHFQSKADNFNASQNGSPQSCLPRFSREGFDELVKNHRLSEIESWLSRISDTNPNLFCVVEQELFRSEDDYKVNTERQTSMKYLGCVWTYAGLTCSLGSSAMLPSDVLDKGLEEIFVV
ncbi:hypothetical protein KY329_04890 [Candidatus Woesearchaeota archaeon]|nr:hypothetical protein [Candidatus Woesearchaeota archaeon]